MRVWLFCECLKIEDVFAKASGAVFNGSVDQQKSSFDGLQVGIRQQWIQSVFGGQEVNELGQCAAGEDQQAFPCGFAESTQ